MLRRLEGHNANTLHNMLRKLKSQDPGRRPTYWRHIWSILTCFRLQVLINPVQACCLEPSTTPRNDAMSSVRRPTLETQTAS